MKFCGRDGSPLVNLSQAAAGFPSLPISPSEIVLLNADDFAARNVNAAPNLHRWLAVDAQQLSQMIVTAVVLGCEQAGSIYLQAGASRGFMLGDGLYISQGPAPNVRWQMWSLEYRLCGILSQGTTRPLMHVVTQLWERNFKRRIVETWLHARTLVLQGLVARNLVSASPDFSAVEVSPAIANLPGEETTEPLKALFGEVSTQRQPIWAALQSDIKWGIAKRAQEGSAVIDLS